MNRLPIRSFRLVALLGLSSCASIPSAPHPAVEVTAFETIPGLGELWLAPDTTLSGRAFDITPWPPPQIELAAASQHDPAERLRASQIAEALPRLLRERLSLAPPDPGEGPRLQLTGRVVRCDLRTVVRLEMEGIHFGAVTFELQWVDRETNRTVAVLRVSRDRGVQTQAVTLATQLDDVRVWIDSELVPFLATK